MGHTQFRIKCLSCELHFVVCTWYPEQHCDRNHFCPECGKQEGKLVYKQDVDTEIFQIVPGNAQFFGVEGDDVPS